METYELKHSTRPFGLYNAANLCYLNSLVQSLLSLPAFVKVLLDHADEFRAANSELGMRLLEFCGQYGVDDEFLNSTDVDRFRRVQNGTTAPILRAIQKSRAGKTTFRTFSQEDAQEGFKFIIEILDEELKSLGSDKEIFKDIFAIRHKQRIRCSKCGHDRTIDRESCPEEIIQNMSEVDPLLQKSLDTQKNIEDHIKISLQIPDDYRCEKCNVQNNIKNKQLFVRQYYTLARISSVIVLSFHYNHHAMRSGYAKRTSWFPQKLEFVDKNGRDLVYKVVSQIEHSGSLRGGHYTANCLRPLPPGYVDTSLTKAQEALAEISTRLKTAREMRNEPRIASLEKKYDVLMDIIRDSKRRLTSNNIFDKTGVWRFNDRTITYERNGFQPSDGTYLVFYHLV